MNKTIKTKESVRNIKTVNRRNNLRHYIRRKEISKLKVNTTAVNNEDATNNRNINPDIKAVNDVINAEKNIAVESAFKTKQVIVKNKIKNQSAMTDAKYEDETIITNENYTNDNQGHDYTDTKIYEKNTSDKDKIEYQRNYSNTDKPSYKKVMKYDEITDTDLITDENITNINIIKQKPYNFTSNSRSYTNTESSSLNEIMHRYSISKYQKKLKEQKLSINNNQIINDSSPYIFNKTITYVKKTATNSTNLFTLGTGLIILVVMALFIGTFSSLSSDSGTDTSTLNLSEEVIAYTPIIQIYAIEYGIEDYIPLIQAVMMQESGGQGDDPMQSSGCGYNTLYADGITDAEYSIDCGVHYLSDCIAKAEVESTTDMEHIKLALQGYNFGSGYITWAVTNFGGYTSSNAKVYSDQKKSELNTSIYGDVDYVEHVLRYYHIGGNLVEVAATQIGNTGNVYWTWYGFSSRVEWCAIFVSWCANESGELNITVPKFSSVEDGISWYKSNNKWKDSSYTPNAGDLIFFDWNSDGDPDHVGIVEKVENGYIYTIEGNSSDEVKEKKYSTDYKRIYGYGIVQ
ncbi:MAG: lysozyme family protein [Erysipelotrichaceae bacterium]|nr:lysozyme family protein [Erysipelotrichaceae bacterium]